MKKNALKILLVAVVAMYATACTKEDTSGTNGGTTGNSDAFVWTENDNTFAAANIIKCDSAYASAQYKTIFVYKGATATKYYFEINVSSLAVANYSIAATGINQVAYVRPGSQIITGTAGNIEITANASSKITGTGTISMPFTTPTSTPSSRVYVRFTNLPVK